MYRLAQINCRGLASKISELTRLIYRLNLDIILLSELKVSSHKKNKNRFSVRIPGFRLFFTSFSAGILVKNTLKIVENPILKKKKPGQQQNLFFTKDIKFQQLRIQNKNSKETLLVFSVYRSPKAGPDSFSDFFSFIAAQQRHEEHVIVAGDFNAHHHSWGCPGNNNAGHNLSHFIHNSPFIIHNGPQPTHAANVIDLVITSAASHNSISQLRVHPRSFFPSDHNVVSLVFTFNQKQNKQTRWRWKLNKKEIWKA